MADEEYEVEANSPIDNFNSIAIATNSDFHATKLPIKNKIRSIEDSYNLAKKQLDESKTSHIALKTECNTMDYNQRETLNCCLTTSLDQIKKLNQELLKIAQSDDCECSKLKQQINQVYQEKIKIQQCVISLNSKVEQLESHVGFEKQ